MTKIKTRFAPSPTGFMHIGNLRSALYPWAFAKAKGGDFILRIEDTDQERSTDAAVKVILESINWLGMTPDAGPYYQMQRINRYKEVLEELKQKGFVYPCYMSQEELDKLRETQMAQKQKPRYDGTWRPEEGKTLPPIPEGINPVWRFKTPKEGSISWQDKGKGKIEISNTELDDLIIARPDGVPTYNFCVVVDDIDMEITHVIRGDDHINNTPRQIHIFNALGKTHPEYAHLPTVLNDKGEKISKRNGAKAVTEYREEGYLPSAMINYLARLGWSHGDDEIFTVEQFLSWFDLEHLGKSATQFDEAKLRWVNAEHIKAMSGEKLAQTLAPYLEKAQITADERIQDLCELYKDRCETLITLIEWISPHYKDAIAPQEEKEKHITEEIKPAIKQLAKELENIEWNKENINAAIKKTIKEEGLKMPQLAIPVRVLIMGKAQTPSLDAVLELHKKEKVLEKLHKL